MTYDVIIIGAGPGGIFSAYELMQRRPEWKVAVLEAGNPLEKRHCPIDGDKVKSCIHCKVCSIMHGFGGAGGMSDGKYNITNNFGGDLYTFTGKEKATPPPTAASSGCAFRITCTCWTLPCGTWARTSTTRSLRTCTPS